VVHSRIGSVFLHLFYPSEKPEGSRSGVAKGLQWVYYGCALGALALNPSDFCNVGGYRCASTLAFTAALQTDSLRLKVPSL
jgi:hypothetical protein